jgi:dCTP deaminase
MSYGTSSYGYDIRCSSEFKLFTNLNSTIVDPKNFDDKSFVDVRGRCPGSEARRVPARGRFL